MFCPGLLSDTFNSLDIINNPQKMLIEYQTASTTKYVYCFSSENITSRFSNFFLSVVLQMNFKFNKQQQLEFLRVRLLVEMDQERRRVRVVAYDT